MIKRRFLSVAALLLAFLLVLTGCAELTEGVSDPLAQSGNSSDTNISTVLDASSDSAGSSEPSWNWDDLSQIPPYRGAPYVTVQGNVPNFSEEELTTTGYESYTPLDEFGRCGVVIASLGLETMPAKGEERGSIGHVYPSGWVQARYDFVDNKYLYNRCHLIGWQLSAENDNECNLITGTRYMNVDGMLPFENMVADYIKETGNHVAYRITPVFEGNNLVCTGVQMEAYSVEDNGDGICFNVFCYNVQPGVTINYGTGYSYITPDEPEESVPTQDAEISIPDGLYILNTSSKKIHLPFCGNAKSIAPANRQEYEGDLDALFDQGYTPCGNCFD